MYRVHFPDGDIQCERYEETDHGLELYNEDDEFLGFVPYGSLMVLINEEVELTDDEPSIAD